MRAPGSVDTGMGAAATATIAAHSVASRYSHSADISMSGSLFKETATQRSLFYILDQGTSVFFVFSSY